MREASCLEPSECWWWTPLERSSERASTPAPAFFTMVGIPLAYSITDGLALGFVRYPVLKLLSGRGRQVGAMSYGMAALLAIYFVFIRSRLS